ncbi:hypothetical protein BaRGS_00033210 [Batillaria attramentaria]|uniref:Uncharacterized protein n=1 Tax=Batillaria attramentaria TaxID=370345 RepID=A0ABD0JKW0_9CAEN|nr:hypothetical protein BaRGS_007323 [Batillaria attramentaria]
MYNFTVVTALLDIGRGEWRGKQGGKYRRTYDDYLHYMQQLLRLDVNLLLFVDHKARPAVDRGRRGKENHTYVVEVRLEDLPYYQHRSRVDYIMKSVEFRVGNLLYLDGAPEATVAEYDILVWSKLYFMHEAMQLNHFSNSYFVWLDAGYGHGNDVYPPDCVWSLPRRLLDNPDKVTIIERLPIEGFRNTTAQLHKKQVAVLCGGFFAGGKRALERLYAIQNDIISEWLERGIADDEQSVFTVAYFREPELFHLVCGDWYDVFKLFRDEQS